MMSEQSVKVLLIDDDEAFLESTQELLSSAGHETQTCQNPTLAMEMIRSFQPQCILLDLKMPNLEGQDLLLLIRKKFADIPVIVCSGVANLDIHYLLKSGASDILKKPFAYTTLFETIRKAVLEQQEGISIVVQGYNLSEIQTTVFRKIIIKALVKMNFDLFTTAALLGISPDKLDSYIEEYQIPL